MLPAVDESEDDLLTGDLRLAAAPLFLGHYTEAELTQRLRERGFWHALAARGFAKARVAIETTGTGPRAVVRMGDVELGELRASHATWRGRSAIVVDWLEMRHPSAPFSPERPRLPGQRAPGLGLGREMLELLISAAARIGAEVIVVRPQHYHNAVLYGRLGFRHADPARQVRLEALERALAGRSLADASWAVEEGRFEDPSTGAPVEWAEFAGDMVLFS